MSKKRELTVFISGPYGDDNSHAVKNKRYGQHSSATAEVFVKFRGIFFPYSPIVSTHNMQRFVRVKTVKTEDWYEYAEHIVRLSDIMLVLMLDGWEQSEGVKREVKLAEEMGIPILYAKFLEVEQVLREYLKQNVGDDFPNWQ